jgi:hypothetical protein
MERQAGALSRPQAAALGIDRHTVRHQVAAGRWQLPTPRVVVLHNGPLTSDQQRWVALLHGGRGAALAGLAAAEVDGLAGYPPSTIDVLVPPDGRVPPYPPMTIHRSRHLDAADVHPLRAPRRTRPARSIVDAAVWATSLDRACALVAAAVQQRLVRPAEVRTVLGRPGALPRRGILTRALADVEGGSHSLAEIDFVRLCRRAGLPTPARQVVRVDPKRRRRYLDAAWPEFRVLVEVDGVGHRDIRQWVDDLYRGNEVMMRGDRVLRFPAIAVRLHPDQVLDQLRRALIAGGWSPASPRRPANRAS